MDDGRLCNQVLQSVNFNEGSEIYMSSKDVHRRREYTRNRWQSVIDRKWTNGYNSLRNHSDSTRFVQGCYTQMIIMINLIQIHPSQRLHLGDQRQATSLLYSVRLLKQKCFEMSLERRLIR